MVTRKPKPTLVERTPVAEWIAAAAGLVLTLGVIGYTVWEGLTEGDGPPRLDVLGAPAVPAGRDYVMPIIVKNASHATAAQVEVRGVLSAPGQAPEERRTSFSYVPGRGEARGGLVFAHDPRGATVVLSVQGYADP